MERALNPDVLMQFLRGFFSVYIKVAKMKTALTWLHISLMNSSGYCIQANTSLACAFVLCSDLRPVFSRTRWNTVSSQVDTIVGNTDDLQCNQNREHVYDFMNKLIKFFWTRCDVSVILCLSSPMWSMKQTFLDTVLIAIITLCVWDAAPGSGSASACLWLHMSLLCLEICGPSSSLASKTLARSGLNDFAFLFAFFTPAFTLLFSGLINCAERPVIELFHVVGIFSQSKRLPFVCVFCCHLSHSWLWHI